jgi:hypothetical protein
LTTRALERQIDALSYERLLSSSDCTAAQQEASSNLTSLQQVPREFVRSSIMLENRVMTSGANGSSGSVTPTGVQRCRSSSCKHSGGSASSAEMALKLCEAFGTSPDFWLNMQIHFDLWQATKTKRKPVSPLVAA